MRMDPEKRAAWVAALRSGKYSQAEGYLHVVDGDGGFCCLGVLCELAVEAGVVQTAITLGDEGQDVISYTDVSGLEDRVLPETVARWAGLITTDDDGFRQHPDTTPKAVLPQGLHGETFEHGAGLIDLNDSHNWSFTQIADAIETDEEARA